MKKRLFTPLILIPPVGLALLIGLGGWIWQIDRTWSPLIEPRLRERQQSGSIRVTATDSTGQDRWIGSLTHGRTEERRPLTLGEIPPQLTQAIVTLEDPRFLEHGGFDIFGILRAAVRNAAKLRYAQGGSTITQQLVKNVFLTNERTLKRKFTELILSAIVEKRFTKDEILEAYMNEVYLGQIGSVEIHGVSRAAEYYFGKKLDQLEVHELALVAAMIAGPGYYSPWKHAERTKARRDRVLRSLAEAKFLLPAELEAALAKPLPRVHNFLAPTKSGYLIDALREELINSRSEMEILKGGFDIRLALDIDLQERLERVLLTKSAEWGPNIQAAFIAADPRDCSIKAYAGGTDYRVTQLDRIRQSRRPIGSLMKPLEVARFLEEDDRVNLAMVIDDSPLKWSFDKGRQTWTPLNYDGKFRGPTSLRHSLEESINVPIVRLFYDREPSGLLSDLLDPVRALGLDIPVERALPSAILGAIDQSPRQTMGAYLRFVRQVMGLAQDAGDFACRLNFEGAPADPNAAAPVSRLAPSASPAAEAAPPVEHLPPRPGIAPIVIAGASPAPSLPPEATVGAAPGFRQRGSRLVVAALEGALRRGTGAAFGRRVPITQAWASKTGTSSDLRDSWYATLSPELVVIAWVGRDDNEKTKFTGATGALPLVADVLSPKPVKGAPYEPAPRAIPSAPWNWPLAPGMSWKPIETTRGCIPARTAREKVEVALPAPRAATPPPPSVAIDGRTYSYELFREGAEPAICDN